MNTLYKDELNNLIYQDEMLGSKACLYTCVFNDKLYVYKEPFNFNDANIDTLEKISTIKNKNLVVPEYLVLSKGKIKGYLTEYLNNYKILFDIDYLNFNSKVKILKSAKKAILTMHSDKIIHGDLSSANIMCKKSNIKIIDFDNSIYNQSSNLTEPNRYALEYLKRNDLDYGIDIFMFNITTLSILYNIPFYYLFDSEIEENLDFNKMKIYEKTKNMKKLNNDDFIIDYY